MVKNTALLIAISALTAGTANAAGRDYIQIVGSSTVYPYATVVAERFGKSGSFKTPKIESTGTGGGAKLFCAGVGEGHPDITNASRAMKSSEKEMCAANGINDIVEVVIGYDGISFANAIEGANLNVGLSELYLATAKHVPNPDGSETFVTNPYKNWNEIRSDLPAQAIEIMGPPPSSGTRDAWEELAMIGGCNTFEWVKALKKSDKDAYEENCMHVREDGAYVEAGENDNLIIQKLVANPNAFGIFGFSFLDQNLDAVKGATVESVQPEFETIADGSYPISRPLFFYVKKDHVGVIPGLEEFLAEFTSENAWGSDGYLADRGLVPLPDDKRAQMAADVKALKPM
ncbi:MAG: substrate-binding domain-containing protein [Gammaproteobacteria bacterium]|nr:substrate-binding domain-containing protein [Gammaproteobacteria bacterium]